MEVVALCGFAWEPKGTARARAFPLMSALAKRGHQVTLITVPYDNPKLSRTEFIKEGVTVRGISLNARIFRFLELPLRVAKEIEAVRPDIVHIFKPKGYAGAIASILLRRGRVPVCIDCDDWEGWGGWNELKPYPHLVKNYIDFQEKWLTRSAHSLTVASRVLLKRALEIGQTEGHVFYTPNCVTRTQLTLLSSVSTTGSLAFKRELGLTKNSLILYAGHFEPADDVLFFCRSVIPALKQGASLALVGEGQEMPKVKRFFAAHPGFNIHYFGRLSYLEYIQVVGAADIACFPYPDTPVYRAKCSARIIDYMACGKAVVTTNVGQNPEYIVTGESGILVSPNAETEFSSALLALLSDLGLRRKLGLAARERISHGFVWDCQPVEECEQAYAVARTTKIRQINGPFSSWHLKSQSKVPDMREGTNNP
jgi:glycosyltransferase involved in cell wall biosynthesis